MEKQLATWMVVGFILISLIGFADAGYLTLQHYRGESPACSIVEGCHTVTSSEWSTIAGVPVAAGGAAYYLLMLILSLWYFEKRDARFVKIVPWLTLLGFLASIWFVYLQLFVIEAICLYCMGSAVTSTLLFILGMMVLKRKDS